MTGLCEELGWTGFVIPRLRVRYGVLTTGLIVGLLRGAWHFVLAAALWLLIATLATANGRQFMMALTGFNATEDVGRRMT